MVKNDISFHSQIENGHQAPQNILAFIFQDNMLIDMDRNFLTDCFGKKNHCES